MSSIKVILRGLQDGKLTLEEAEVSIEMIIKAQIGFKKWEPNIGNVSMDIMPVVPMEMPSLLEVMKIPAERFDNYIGNHDIKSKTEDSNMMMSSFKNDDNDAFTDSGNFKKFGDY